MTKKGKFIYIAHPIGGDVTNNIEKVKAIVRDISLYGTEVIPFAPYVVDLLSLRDDVPEERARGMWHNDQLLRSGIIHEIWLYGPRISEGMKAEIKLAKELGIPVFAQSEATEAELKEA